jgi:aspartate/methionine/tyrosine aminotransferase
LKSILNWAEKKKIHVLADEIYALSVIDSSSEEKTGPVVSPFVSVGELGDRLGPYVHFLWGAAKDLALSGSRIGVLYTGLMFPLDAF